MSYYEQQQRERHEKAKSDAELLKSRETEGKSQRMKDNVVGAIAAGTVGVATAAAGVAFLPALAVAGTVGVAAIGTRRAIKWLFS